jgi:1-aminocyclopropane-1-carboxylate deaminase/D-cysteine desulfhydrase-like pyridoxal-dependent ACC family enzyme
MTTLTPHATARLSPVEDRRGLLYKREDTYALSSGVNGAKLRACQHLIQTAYQQGARRVITACSVLSPQSAMAAVTARQLGMDCTVILGGTRPDTALRHPSIRIAAAHGADFRYIGVGYNPALQKAAKAAATRDPHAYYLRYGITTPPDTDVAGLRAFHEIAAHQTRNLPGTMRTLVVPFGSGNTGAGVLYGLYQRPPSALERIALIAIGPDRQDWLKQRLTALRAWPPPAPIELHDLHGTGYASYGDKMPETLDGIRLHPTYEGKVARYLNGKRPPWWTRRDSTTCLWIVGGPLPNAR